MTSFQFRRTIIWGGLPLKLRFLTFKTCFSYPEHLFFAQAKVKKKKTSPSHFTTPLASVVLLASVVPLPRFPAASVAASGLPRAVPAVHGRTPGSSRRPPRPRPPPWRWGAARQRGGRRFRRLQRCGGAWHHYSTAGPHWHPKGMGSFCCC